MRYLLPTLCTLLALHAQEEWELYHAPGADTAALAEQVQPKLPPGAALKLQALPPTHSTPSELRLHARAMAAGVSELPSLVLRDAQGAYASMPLNRLTPEAPEQLRRQAAEAEHSEAARYRVCMAQLYLLCALLDLTTEPSDRERITARMHELMQAPDTPENARQFIGMHGLYPTLMQQYAEGYQGAHTPRTEAKLLEAIGVLEAVRDMNPTSYLGRVAYDEREKLRAARLRSRQYE